MKESKQTIKLNESQLRQVIKESIKKVLNESSYDTSGNFDKDAHNKDLMDRFTDVLSTINTNINNAVQSLSYIENASIDERLSSRARIVINALINAGKEMRRVNQLTDANRWDID